MAQGLDLRARFAEFRKVRVIRKIFRLFDHPKSLGNALEPSHGGGDRFQRTFQGGMIFDALEETQAAGGEIPVDTEQRFERLGELSSHIVVIAVRLHAVQPVERGAPLRFERFDAGEFELQAFGFRAGGKMGVGVRLAFDELGEPDFPAVGEMLERAQGGDLQAATIGLRDEVPERFAQHQRVRAAFEVDAIEELDDRLADLAATRHDGTRIGC